MRHGSASYDMSMLWKWKGFYVNCQKCMLLSVGMLKIIINFAESITWQVVGANR